MSDALLTDELLDAVEKAIEDHPDRDLKAGIPACIAELEYCKRALARLDHLFGRALDDVDRAQAIWENIEAKASAHARSEVRKAATAAEVKGAMADYVNDRPEDVKVRGELRDANRRLEKLRRWQESFARRMSAAQTAQNGHEALGRYGGGG